MEQAIKMNLKKIIDRIETAGYKVKKYRRDL